MATLMAGHFFHTVYTVNLATSMEQETERRESKGRRCCLGAVYSQLNAALAI